MKPTSGQVRSQSMVKFLCSSENGSTTAFKYEPRKSTIRWITNQPLRLPVVNIAFMCDKIAVSDRTADVLVLSVLEEAGVIDDTNKKKSCCWQKQN